MRINRDKSSFVPPFTIVLLDAMDAYYYADIMDNMEEVTKLDDYEKAVALSDALFVTKNYGWESLQAMNEVDGGYDVRVYDSSMSCVYAAHTKYISKWIGESVTDLIFTPTIQKAIRFSIKTHEIYQKQKRKGKDTPYITHPLTVGHILAQVGSSDEVVIAGILHDTIEDSTADKKVTTQMIRERFGESVATLVESVTEKEKDLPWEERKREALGHIKSFSNESVLVKSADVISNMAELLDDHEQEGENIWTRFNAPKEKMLENAYRVIYALIKQWPESPLVANLHDIRDRLVKIETCFVEGGTNGFFIGGVRDGISDRWFVKYLEDDDNKNYKELGRGGSPLGVTFHMMINHSPGKYERIAGYKISESGVGSMIQDAMSKVLPEHPQAQENMTWTYILYEKKD